jgi:hypothetical protein
MARFPLLKLLKAIFFPDKIHDFLTHADWLHAYQALEFFDKHLRK